MLNRRLQTYAQSQQILDLRARPAPSDPFAQSISGTGRLYFLPDGYNAQAEQVMVFTVTAWVANCPKHIPVRFDAADVQSIQR